MLSVIDSSPDTPDGILIKKLIVWTSIHYSLWHNTWSWRLTGVCRTIFVRLSARSYVCVCVCVCLCVCTCVESEAAGGHSHTKADRPRSFHCPRRRQVSGAGNPGAFIISIRAARERQDYKSQISVVLWTHLGGSEATEDYDDILQSPSFICSLSRPPPSLQLLNQRFAEPSIRFHYWTFLLKLIGESPA